MRQSREDFQRFQISHKTDYEFLSEAEKVVCQDWLICTSSSMSETGPSVGQAQCARNGTTWDDLVNVSETA